MSHVTLNNSINFIVYFLKINLQFEKKRRLISELSRNKAHH